MTMLKRLSEDSVFSIEKTDDGFKIWEECDHYYDFPCTKEDLLQLAQEIIDLANGESK